MLLIKTKTGPSALHGTGLFAAQDIAKGQTVWRYSDRVDYTIPVKDLRGFSAAMRKFIDFYGVKSGQVIYLAGDDSNYMNHSRTPNLETHGVR
jgi:SET domain-containing protein